ncbi:MAG TPA: hypothetical protein ENJ15_01155 [Caldithrix abyssi]|uniref:Aerotolerance regulator N-terminal domain-containing protein n=1 Tax=Caldithrix abyssi TaxID=187145 RepID=A0A7V5RNI7_CALAY|nr:hypothetical protein [Caldithrix abyssi]
MLSFINSFILPFFLAALIPLVLHLLNRTRTREFDFSAVHFLKSIEASRIKKVRLLQLLLILIRTLLIIALVLIFARLIWAGTRDNGAGQTTAVIILDDSYSMQTYLRGTPLFDQTLHTLEKMLAFFDEKDRIFVIRGSGGQVDSPVPRGPLGRRYRAGNGTFHWPLLYPAIDSLFTRFPNSHRELFLLSDLRVAAYDSSRLRQQARFYYHSPAADAPVNISIDSVYLAASPEGNGAAYTFNILLKNHSPKPLATTVRLFREDQLAGRRFVELKAGEAKETALDYEPGATGRHLLRFELDNDDLTLDNRYYYVLNIPERLSVLYVSGRPDTMMQAAVAALNQIPRLHILSVPLYRWQTVNDADYDLLLFQAPASLKPSDIDKMKNFLSSGRRLILIPQDADKSAEYNAILKKISGKSPVKNYISYPGRGFMNLRLPPAALRASLRENTKKRSPDYIPFYRYYTLKGGRAPLFFENKAPFYIEHDNLRLFAADFNPAWGALPTRSSFIPFLALQLISGGSVSPPAARVGQVLSFNPPPFSGTAAHAIRLPDGRTLPARLYHNGERWLVKTGHTATPGFYTLLRGGRPLIIKAVNIDPREWRPVNRDMPGTALHSPTKESWREQVVNRRRGMEFTTYFIILALLLAAAEMILIKKLETGAK